MPISRTVSVSPPTDTVIVSLDCPVHLPSFVRRSAYAPTRPDEVLRGVGLDGGLLLVAVRGQSAEFVESRLKAVRSVFRGSGRARSAAFERIVEDIDRPVAFVLALPRDAALHEWVKSRGTAEIVWVDEHSAVHLVAD